MILALALFFVDHIYLPEFRPLDPINDRQPPLMACGGPLSDKWLEVQISIDDFGAASVAFSVTPPPAPRWVDCSVLTVANPEPAHIVCQEQSVVYVSTTPDLSWPLDCSPLR